MPQWCPECRAMLPEGMEECPRCGAALPKSEWKDEDKIKRSAVFWYSLYTIAIALVPILIGVGIGLLCILLFITRAK